MNNAKVFAKTIKTSSTSIVYFFHRFALKIAPLFKEKYIHTVKQRYKTVEETFGSLDLIETSAEKGIHKV